MLAQLHQRLLLLLCNLRGAGRGVDAPLFHRHRPHRVGQQLGQRTLDAVGALLGKIAGQAVVQRLFIQRGL